MGEGGRESRPYGGFRSHPSVDAALGALGGAQWAVFSVSQLVELGFSADVVQKRAAAGRLHRQYRGVYSLVPRRLLKRQGVWLAAVLACGDGAVLSHRSAAALHGLVAADGVKSDVTVPRRSARKHTRISVHRSTTLAPQDTTTVDNIPCTTVARTLFDLAEVLHRRPLERAFDQAEILEVFDLTAIEGQLARNPTRKATAKVKALLAEHYIGSTATWSELEESFLALVREAGLPPPEVNAWVVLDDGGPAIRPDFVWREQRVMVEVDGRKFHRTRQAVHRDERRDQRSLVAGWRPVRTSHHQLEHAPGEVVQAVVALVKEPRSRP